jgi:NodT family efflux transporter outer membrane factor (OMF) lipoprotein
MKPWKLLALAAPMALAGCVAGPNYVRPEVTVPDEFKEAKGWKQAEPRDAEARGEWWALYNDPVLAALQREVSVSNQNLAQAEARFRQARALVESARAGFFPSLNGALGTTRSRSSSTTVSQPSAAPVSRGVVSNYSLRFDSSWELDLWGRVSRTVEANFANAQASIGDIEAARLSAQAQLAQSYFQIRSLDAQRQLLEDAIAAYQRSVQLTQNQYNVGVAARVDVVQATAQLKSTQAQAVDLGVQRAQLEHAIAVLVGKAPAELSIAPASVALVPPAIPIELPSELLERRPDIAAAERRVAAANAQIGVASAAYFPALTLSAAGGLQSARLSDWLTAPSRFWSLGPAMALNLFDAGLRRAQTDQAVAAYDASVAAYRQAVLASFQEVEDQLAALRILEEEAAVQAEAMEASKQALELSLNQYKAGLINYLQVVVTQTNALNAMRAANDIASRRMIASVQLVKALGGGWDSYALPDYATMKTRAQDTR